MGKPGKNGFAGRPGNPGTPGKRGENGNSGSPGRPGRDKDFHSIIFILSISILTHTQIYCSKRFAAGDLPTFGFDINLPIIFHTFEFCFHRLTKVNVVLQDTMVCQEKKVLQELTVWLEDLGRPEKGALMVSTERLFIVFIN